MSTRIKVPVLSRYSNRRTGQHEFLRADSATSVRATSAEVTVCHADVTADFVEELPSLPEIAPRSFNTLRLAGKTVTKTSLSKSIHGELHFYQHIPVGVTSFFPSLRAFTCNPVSFTIDRIYGPTLSTLLVSGQLTPKVLSALVQSLHTLHNFATPPPHTPLLYANHHAKVSSRFREHERGIYAAVNLTGAEHFAALLGRLRDFELYRRGKPAAIVHGDPVLTNVMRAGAPPGKIELKLIDMRGALGDVLTLAGDATYDLAKVLQSLLGYDFVLAGEQLDGRAARSLTGLLGTFWSDVKRLYPDVMVEDVVLVTCALYSSLIPLHDNLAHQLKFAVFAAVLLQALEDGTVGNAAGDLMRRIRQELAKTA